GGINYGAAKDTTADTTDIRAAITRGKSLSRLPFTIHEISQISAMLSNENISNIIYKDSAATEKAFKARSQKKDYVIHISTHGFFNQNSDLRSSMVETGLFFAGANKYWVNDSIPLAFGDDDGILRAAEIAEMNLSGCGLVVLSACETGLGFSNTSEGVYGLQRAFKLAGADLVLMSLWNVDDMATSLLMTEFYKNLLSGSDPHIALNQSSKAVREKFPSPKYWGAFVLLE
ncbi:MAG: CHAT domain-containing protein, partial [Bacteroidales bacterium]|nr:CHAT domain-containing protein [Bacteroidales bacterium]